MNAKKIENYLRIIENLYNRLLRQVERAIDNGLDAEDLNATLIEDIRPAINQAEDPAELENIGTLLEGIEEGLKELRRGPKK